MNDHIHSNSQFYEDFSFIKAQLEEDMRFLSGPIFWLAVTIALILWGIFSRVFKWGWDAVSGIFIIGLWSILWIGGWR